MKLFLLQLGLLQPLRKSFVSAGRLPAASMLDPETRVVFPDNDGDETTTRASTRKLVEIARRERVAVIIHGHDHEQWPTLKQAPEWFG